MDNNETELSVEDLQNVHAGNSYGMSEIIASSHPDLFRAGQIERLREEGNTVSGETELSESDLQNVHARNSYGMSEIIASSNPDLFRASQMEKMLEESAESNVSVEEKSGLGK